DGTCRPTCNPADADSCEDDEVCEAVEGTSYGFCRLLSSFCFEQGDCAGGQVCDNAIGSSTFGRCVDACTPAVPADVCAGIAAADRCTATDTASCTDADTLRTCAPNAQGCLVWTDTTCTDGCDDSGA